MKKISSVILAGGKSQRFGGKRKALETIGGRSVIERVAGRVSQISDELLVVISRDRFSLPADCNAQTLEDIYPDKGPLGGIYTGLLASQSSHSLVVACDTPFLNVRLLNYMVEMIGDFDAVVPRLEGGRVEALHAIYSKGCLGHVKAQLENNQLRADSFLNTICVR